MIKNQSISSFMLHDQNGKSILFDDATGNPECGYEGPTVKYTWNVGALEVEIKTPDGEGLYIFPDGTGALFFEKTKRSDNLLILDVFGKKILRLCIPWQLTWGQATKDRAKYPSGFIGVTAPWDNINTQEKGRFSVLAWVENGGGYYAFELDWNTGNFLWGHRLEHY